MQNVTPGEFVVVQGLQGTEMFFVKAGKLEVRMSIGDDAVKKLLTASSRYAVRVKSVAMEEPHGANAHEALVHRMKQWIFPV
jgi:hypothetical protein